MSIIKKIAKEAKGMLLDGIGASQHIDSSGEILDVKGCDIKDVDDGVAVINYEHKDESPTDVIGRLVYAKKIFGAEDCDDERQSMYWKKSGVPFIYIIGELMDQDGHQGAQDAAAIVRHYHSRGLPIVARWSIEGSTLDKDKSTGRLKRSIFKRIALTLKPCNKDATSGVLFDPQEGKSKKVESSLKTVMDKVDKFEHPAYMKLGGAIEIECMPWIDDMAKAELSKEEQLKEKLKEVIKSWDGKGELKAFLKSALPEISDSFLDKFATAADGYTLKVKKFEKLQETIQMVLEKAELLKGEDESTPDEKPNKLPNIEFQGKQVKPGKALTADEGLKQFFPEGRIALLGHDPEEGVFYGVHPDKINGWTDKDIKKIDVGHPGLNVHEFPEEINTAPIVDAGMHGMNLTPAAAQMVQGLELDPKNVLSKKHIGTHHKAYWAKNAQGKTVFVKPEVENQGFGDTIRESAFHNAAHEVFGLGNYLPTVATVRHPKTGQLHSVIEAVPGEHTEVQSWTGQAPNKQEHINTLNKLGDAGELTKMAIMDAVMTNNDRHHQNYLYTPEGSLKLIDHGGAFENGNLDNHPDYLEKYDKIKRNMGQPGHDDQSIKPQVAQWLMNVNPANLKRSLRKNGVPLAVASETTRKLSAMQTHLMQNPQTSNFNLLSAPAGITKDPKTGQLTQMIPGAN